MIILKATLILGELPFSVTPTKIAKGVDCSQLVRDGSPFTND
jgi:hypothetical protein